MELKKVCVILGGVDEVEHRGLNHQRKVFLFARFLFQGPALQQSLMRGPTTKTGPEFSVLLHMIDAPVYRAL